MAARRFLSGVLALAQEVLKEAGKPGLEGAAAPAQPVPGHDRTSAPDLAALGLAAPPTTTAAVPPVASPFRPPQHAVLTSPMDTANCGDFSFALYTAQLIVSMLGTAGGVGGEYAVPALPLHTWTRLIGRDGRPLPVLVLRDHGALQVQCGNVPDQPGPTASPTR